MRVVVTIAGLLVLCACRSDDSALPTVTAISPEGARHETPAYSADGKRLAWWAAGTDSIADWQLWVGAADMSAATRLPVTALFPSLPVWSPDGARIASVSNQHGSVHVVLASLPGGGVQQLTQGTGVEYPLSFEKSGDRLSYYGSAEGGTFRSRVVSTRSGVNSPLVPGEKGAVAGRLSPDGSHVAYFIFDGGRSTIWVADGIGGTPRQLTSEGFESLVQFHEWSPDSKELLYQSRRTGTTDLWVVPIDGGKPRQLTRDVRNDFGGVWSSNGKWVAFISDRGRQTDIWVVPSGGGVERRVTDTREEEQPPLTWRPGTNALAFTTNVERSGVWTLDLASGKERRLTPDSIRTGAFDIARDGTQVLYVIEHGGGIQDLAVVPLAGGAARTLVAGAGTVVQPHWSPDGSRIVFISDRGGSNDVWIVDAAGGPPRQLVNWPSRESAAVWSGDGTAIYFTSNRDSRLGDLWKVAPGRGEPTRLTTDGSLSGGVFTRAGVPDVFAGIINPRGGQLAIAGLRADGKLQPVWEKTTAFLRSISPTGDSVAVLAEQPGGKQRSMILSASSGEGRVILRPGEDVGNWSNDGVWLLYTMTAGGARDLGVMRLADGTTRRLTTTRENEAGAVFTPDGKSVVFRRVQTVERIFTVDLSKLLTAKQ